MLASPRALQSVTPSKELFRARLCSKHSSENLCWEYAPCDRGLDHASSPGRFFVSAGTRDINGTYCEDCIDTDCCKRLDDRCRFELLRDSQ